jgi:hypothetical protein
MHTAQDRYERARGKLWSNLKDCNSKDEEEEALYHYPITI